MALHFHPLRVTSVERDEEGVFVVETASARGVRRTRQARAVVLAIGYYDRPNMLDVPVTLGAIALQGLRRAQPTLGETFAVIGLGLLALVLVAGLGRGAPGANERPEAICRHRFPVQREPMVAIDDAVTRNADDALDEVAIGRLGKLEHQHVAVPGHEVEFLAPVAGIAPVARDQAEPPLAAEPFRRSTLPRLTGPGRRGGAEPAAQQR